LLKRLFKGRNSEAEMPNPNRRVSENHRRAGSERRRGGILRSGMVPPSAARR
jgi:hypothetical protein